MTRDITHKHQVSSWMTVIFSGCVAPDQCTPEAHGHVTDVSTCPCGAIQRTNVNRGYREIGPWEETTPRKEE
jgi:hypothetical protein